jgi:hypothetical protein
MAGGSAGDDDRPDREPIAEVARSFYERLRTEGFTHDQIVHLANDMLSLVREDLVSTSPPAPSRDDG